MITFNHLVNNFYEFDNIYLEIEKEYHKSNKQAYYNAWSELKRTRPKYNQGVIHIEYVDDGCYHNVYQTNQSERYAMDFVPWDEVLGMEVDIGNYTYEEALAHILWEITFYGYSNAKVQETAAVLDKVAKEAFND